jgi:hypothetical protein
VQAPELGIDLLLDDRGSQFGHERPQRLEGPGPPGRLENAPHAAEHPFRIELLPLPLGPRPNRLAVEQHLARDQAIEKLVEIRPQLDGVAPAAVDDLGRPRKIPARLRRDRVVEAFEEFEHRRRRGSRF